MTKLSSGDLVMFIGAHPWYFYVPPSAGLVVHQGTCGIVLHSNVVSSVSECNQLVNLIIFRDSLCGIIADARDQIIEIVR